MRLQAFAGNQAVVQLVAVQRTPEDNDFDPDYIVNELALAIDNDSETHGDQGTQRFVKIDGRAAGSALADLTPVQANAVEKRWKERDKRDLRELINGRVLPVRWSGGSAERLIAMLDGTKADRVTDPWGESDDQTRERLVIEKRSLELDAAELYAAFRERNRSNLEVIYAMLRKRAGTPDRNAALDAVYQKNWKTTVKDDIQKYMLGNTSYVEALYSGDAIAAAAGEFDNVVTTTQGGSAFKDNAQLAEDYIPLLDRLHQADAGKGDVLRAVLAQQTHRATGRTLGDYLRDKLTPAAVDAYASGDLIDSTAAKLALWKRFGKLKPRHIEQALQDIGATTRDLSTAEGDYEKEKELDAAFVKLAVRFYEIQGTPQRLAAAEFRSLIATLGKPIERERNLTLLTGRGEYGSDNFPTSGMGDKPLSAEVKQLEMALRQESLPHIREALGGRSEEEIRVLAREYKLQVGRDLEMDLQTALLFHGGKLEADEIWASWHGDVFKRDPNRDEKGNLLAEGLFLYGRIGLLHRQAKDRLSLYARARDWYGNEEHDLVEGSKEAADKANQAIISAANTGVAELKEVVSTLRLATARLKRAIAVHDEASQRSFTEFVNAAVGLVTLAASLVGGPSGMLLRTIVAKVGTKLVLLGDDYSAKDFIEDVASEATGAIGGQVAVGLLGKGIGGISSAARRAKLPLNPEIASLAGRGTRWAADQVGSHYGQQLPGVVLSGKDFKGPGLQEFMQSLGMHGLNVAKGKIVRGVNDAKGAKPSPALNLKNPPVDAAQAKADQEIAKLGKLDKEGETREFLRKNDAVRLNLIKLPAANRVLKRCASLCYPEQLEADPNLVVRTNEALAEARTIGPIDEGAVTLYLYERRENIAAAVHTLEAMAKPETLLITKSGKFIDRTPHPQEFNQRIRRANRRDPAEVASLAAGTGVRPPPRSEPEWDISNRTVLDAQQTLSNPNAGGPQQTHAMQAILARAVSDYRQIRERELVGDNKTPVLNAQNLKLCCGQGRDFTAEAIKSMTQDSKIPITIDRYLAYDLHVPQSHAFAVVRTPDGQAFIVDPTFAQFADRLNRPAAYTAGDMVASREGAALALQLMRDGFIPLTQANAQLYMLGLGAKSNSVASVAGVGLLKVGTNSKAFMSERVRNGEIEPTVNNAKTADNEVLDRDHWVHEIEGLLKDPRLTASERAILDDVLRRLRALPATTSRRTTVGDGSRGRVSSQP